MSTIEVAFVGTWITDVATGTSVKFLKTDRTETDQRDVQVRSYAGGRRRIISTPRRERTTPLTLRSVSDTDLEILRDWTGRLLLLRDGQGWRRWGTFAGIQPSTVHSAPSLPIFDVSLTWLDVDYSDAV
jgi:hypothetical protein